MGSLRTTKSSGVSKLSRGSSKRSWGGIQTSKNSVSSNVAVADTYFEYLRSFKAQQYTLPPRNGSTDRAKS